MASFSPLLMFEFIKGVDVGEWRGGGGAALTVLVVVAGAEASVVMDHGETRFFFIALIFILDSVVCMSHRSSWRANAIAHHDT